MSEYDIGFVSGKTVCTKRSSYSAIVDKCVPTKVGYKYLCDPEFKLFVKAALSEINQN